MRIFAQAFILSTAHSVPPKIGSVSKMFSLECSISDFGLDHRNAAESEVWSRPDNQQCSSIPENVIININCDMIYFIMIWKLYFFHAIFHEFSQYMQISKFRIFHNFWNIDNHNFGRASPGRWFRAGPRHGDSGEVAFLQPSYISTVSITPNLFLVREEAGNTFQWWLPPMSKMSSKKDNKWQ